MNTQKVRFAAYKALSKICLTWYTLTFLMVTLNAYAATSDKHLEYAVSYLTLTKEPVVTFTNINKLPEDSGYLGAKLAISDSNSTGKFMQQHFSISKFEFEQANSLLDSLEQRYQNGEFLFLLDADPTSLVAIDKWAQNKSVLLFNVSESADTLRYKTCLSSVLHTLPSDRMKSDALAQWLVARRLSKVLLVRGKTTEDQHLAQSFKLAAKRYGLTILDEKVWDFNTDLRRSTQQEIPLFTQTSKPYDVVYVADAFKDFAEFLPYNTYFPRPVIGSAGLEALAWHRVIEQWGAAQLQSRFNKMANRDMNELDFSAYLAVRSIAQAAQQTRTTESETLKAFIHSDNFELAAYKGRKLSFRKWNGQIRMPLALIQPNALVSQSPQTGMLHPRNELDTLGFDAPEMQCTNSL